MSTLDKPSSSKDAIKLWRPPNLAGLEIEVRDISRMRTPATVLEGYEITVPIFLIGTATLNVRGITHTFTTFDFTHSGGFALLTNPGDIGTSASKPGIQARALTLRLPEHLIQTYTSKLVDASSYPYFPSYQVDTHLAEPLAVLARNTAVSFQQESSVLERESKVLGLVHALMRCSDAPSNLRDVGKEHRAVAIIKDAIHADIAGDFSLDKLALLTGLNARYFLSVFKREVGVSPHEYQTNLRVLRAKQLLARGLPVAVVAADLGFSDQSHLTRVFKRYTFMTPGRFQRVSWQNT